MFKIFGKKKKSSSLSSRLLIDKPASFRRARFKTSRTLRVLTSNFNKNLFRFINYKFVLIFITITFFGLLIGLTFFSKLFILKDINVVRDIVYVNQQEIEQFLEPIKGRNVLLLSASDIESEVLNKFPELKEVRVIKSLPQGIRVYVKSYPIFARIKNENIKKEYLLNIKGIVIDPEINNENTNQNQGLILIEIPIYQDILEKEKDVLMPVIELKQAKKILSEDMMSNLEKIITTYNNNFSVPLTKIDYLPIEKEVHLILKNNTKILFALERDIPTQFFKLKAGGTENKFSLENGETVYIDLRLSQDRFDVCNKGMECAK